MQIRLAAALVGVALLLAPAAQAHGPGVEISAQAVTPAELTITAGQTVHFHNRDQRTHVVVGENDAFRSPVLAADEGWHVRFPFAGRFPFHLEARPELHGVIVVKEARP